MVSIPIPRIILFQATERKDGYSTAIHKLLITVVARSKA
jgi:hypothetical protein